MTNMKHPAEQIAARKTSWLLPLLSLALAMALVLASCVPVDTPPPEAPEYVVDDLGRLVAVEATPQRIVSLAPANTEVLFALGLGERIVGVTEFCDYPPEALDKETVGGFYPPDIEKIIALQPDLILAGDIHRHDVIPALEERGFTVFTLAPQTLDEILGSIEAVGTITGQEQEASALVGSMQSKLDEVQGLTAELEERPRVLYVTWHEPLWTVGRNTWIDDLIAAAGGENIFSPYFESGAMVEIEWAIVLDPEVIIACTGHGEAKDWPLEWARTHPLLEDTEARKTNSIYQVDADFVSRYGPRLMDALEWFAYFIHPEIFEEPEGH